MRPRCTKRGVTYHVFPIHLLRRSPAGRSYPNPARVALGAIPQCSNSFCTASNSIERSVLVNQQHPTINQPEPDSCTQGQRESKETFESSGVGWPLVSICRMAVCLPGGHSWPIRSLHFLSLLVRVVLSDIKSVLVRRWATGTDIPPKSPRFPPFHRFARLRCGVHSTSCHERKRNSFAVIDSCAPAQTLATLLFKLSTHLSTRISTEARQFRAFNRLIVYRATHQQCRPQRHHNRSPP